MEAGPSMPANPAKAQAKHQLQINTRLVSDKRALPPRLKRHDLNRGAKRNTDIATPPHRIKKPTAMSSDFMMLPRRRE